MIINGEKVPAFSATTLSIPDTPKDNFDAIVENSRMTYARARSVVEAEIRATIEQSEKYKKELSDSGRQEEGTSFQVIREDKKDFNRGDNRGSFKPFRPTPTPQADFRRTGMSPNTAEGKEGRPGLKDLAKLVGSAAPAPAAPASSGKPHKKGNQHKKGKQNAPFSPVKEKSTPIKESGKPADSTPVSSPVRPEVVLKEKSPEQITTSVKPLKLDQPIKDTSKFAEVDNSVDGFLGVKH